MIICFIGGVGSGKTLSVVREIVRSQGTAYTNFMLKPAVKNHVRLRNDHIIQKTKSEDGKKDLINVNWDFWDGLLDKHANFSIYLDEVHHLISSRDSMSKRNKMLTRFISQIRKILSDAPTNHIYLITQRLKMIDIHWRFLMHIIVKCSVKKVGKKIWVKQRWYEGEDNYERGRPAKKIAFLGNPYFKYYDSYAMVRGADEEVYL